MRKLTMRVPGTFMLEFSGEDIGIFTQLLVFAGKEANKQNSTDEVKELLEFLKNRMKLYLEEQEKEPEIDVNVWIKNR